MTLEPVHLELEGRLSAVKETAYMQKQRGLRAPGLFAEPRADLCD